MEKKHRQQKRNGKFKRNAHKSALTAAAGAAAACVEVVVVTSAAAAAPVTVTFSEVRPVQKVV